MNPPRKTAAAKSWPNLWGPRKAKLFGERSSRRNKIESVISGGVYVGNDTSHERQSDFFVGKEEQRSA